jgi:GntR family transcriptional regulator, trigonelline degradation regulator
VEASPLDRPTTVREQAADVIRRAIVEMRLKPGARLVERDLVEWTGASRATVREAIRELASERLVRTTPQKGAIVAALTWREATEVYEVRAALEALAAKLFAERATGAQRAALRRSFDRIQKVLGSPSGTWAMLEAKNAFYAALFAGARNDAMVSMISLLQARIAVLRATTMSQPGRAAEAVEEIRAITEAINARDGEAAASAAARHVHNASHYALAALREREAGTLSERRGRERPAMPRL